jgi:glutathione S-transferase
MDAAILRFLEEQARHEYKRSDPWIQRQNMKIILALDSLELEFGKQKASPAFHVGHIGVFIALSYLDLRFGFENWREKRPVLKGWFEKMLEKPSLKNNRPRDLHPLPDPNNMDHLS